MADHNVVAYLKPTCGWSKGVRAILQKYGLPFKDKDVINNAWSYPALDAVAEFLIAVPPH